MRVTDFSKIDTERHNRVTFIRIEPTDLRATIEDIIRTLSDLSWISQFDEEYIQECFMERAQPTIEDITYKLTSSSIDSVSSDAGEYIVSELSRSAIVQQMNYLSVPLSELYSKQKSGNPGFDFHTQSDCGTLIFGEAKYSSTQNAYGVGLKQVIEFINERKDIKDIADLRDFFSTSAISKASKGTKGFAVGFSAKSTSSINLIRNIVKNEDYEALLEYEEIVLVAVNV